MATMTLPKPASLTRRGNPKPVDNETRYHFVTTEDEVDLIRVQQEAPIGTQFILVEGKTRGFNRNTPKSWTLFIHNSVLTNPIVTPKGRDGKRYPIPFLGQNLGPFWGSKRMGNASCLDYRYVSFTGKLPYEVKQDVAKLRRLLEGIQKNTETVVTYL